MTQFTATQADEFMRKLKWIMIIGGLVVVVPLVILVVIVDRHVLSLEKQLHFQPPDAVGELSPGGGSDALPWEPVAGQLVYVPAYSHVYHQQGEANLLTITLSIRNTDLAHEIAVTSVRYFDTNGNEVKSYVSQAKLVGPLATIEFLVARDDKQGGSGASFLVEWSAAQEVSEPILEAVMIDTTSQQGISFVRTGKVLKQLTTDEADH